MHKTASLHLALASEDVFCHVLWSNMLRQPQHNMLSGATVVPPFLVAQAPRLQFHGILRLVSPLRASAETLNLSMRVRLFRAEAVHLRCDRNTRYGSYAKTHNMRRTIM